MSRKDYHPGINKTDMPREVFAILNLTFDELDDATDSPSGGGSTVTKQAWSKILKKTRRFKRYRSSVLNKITYYYYYIVTVFLQSIF
jgi:hypothetical protein